MQKPLSLLSQTNSDLANNPMIQDGMEGFNQTFEESDTYQKAMAKMLLSMKEIRKENEAFQKKSRFFPDTTDDERALRKLKKEFTFFDETDDARAGRKNEIEEVGMLEKAYKSFNRGFKENFLLANKTFKVK